jgi:hypothetical protein
VSYSQSSWRNAAAPIIAKVIDEVGTDDMRALRQALREAYPWGEKRMHPYRIWCNEIRRQLSGAPPPDTRRPTPAAPGQLTIPTDCEPAAPPAASPATMGASAARPDAPLTTEVFPP